MRTHMCSFWRVVVHIASHMRSNTCNFGQGNTCRHMLGTICERVHRRAQLVGPHMEARHVKQHMPLATCDTHGLTLQRQKRQKIPSFR